MALPVSEAAVVASLALAAASADNSSPSSVADARCGGAEEVGAGAGGWVRAGATRARATRAAEARAARRSTPILPLSKKMGECGQLSGGGGGTSAARARANARP